MRILTACPHSLRKDRLGVVYDTLSYWLESVKALGSDLYCFPNDTPYQTLDIPHDYGEFGYVIDSRTSESRMAHVKGSEYARFAEMRNRVLDYAVNGEYDYLFSIDSDIVVRPGALEHLLETIEVICAAHKCGMVALLVNNQIRDRLLYPGAIYNCGSEDSKGLARQCRGKDLPHGEMKSVAYTGACALIDLAFVREHDIQYRPCAYGEDLAFSKDIRSAGGECWIDCSKEFEAYHIQEPWLIPGVEKYRDGALANEAYQHAISVRVA